MGVNISSPTIKLNNVGTTSKKCGDLKKVSAEALSERQGLDRDIDQSRASLNIYEGYTSSEQLMAYSKAHIAELNKKAAAEGKRKIRSDAVVMVATVLKPPAHFMNGLSREDQIRLLKDGVEGFADIVGKANVKSAAYHFDEQGSHVHVFWEPMTADGRLSAKEAVSLKTFSRINKELPQFMRARGWDIEDCNVYDEAEDQAKRKTLGEEEYRKQTAEKRAKNGRSSLKYKAEAEEARRKAEAEVEELESTVSDLRAQAIQKRDEIENLDSELSAMRTELEVYKATPAPESEEELSLLSKVKRFLKKKTVELSEKVYEKCLGAYRYYHKAKAMDERVDAFIKSGYDNTAEKHKERLAKAEKERDEAKRERDKAKAETKAVMEENEALRKSNTDLRWLVSAICDKFMFVRGFVRDMECELQAEERDREDDYYDHDEEEL